MVLSYHHGARVTESSDSPIAFAPVSTAVIGMVTTGKTADALAFPLNTPVLFNSARDAIAKAGTGNELFAALSAIADQVRCPVVVVRVEEGIDDAATDANIIGTTDANGRYTGMKALLAAQGRLGVRPRIIGCPGHDSKPVNVALQAIAKQLKAFAYGVCGDCDTVSDALEYREAFSARELMLIWPEFTATDSAGVTKTVSTVGLALGLRAQIDQTTGWHKTLSNVPVIGPTGISKDVYFDYLAEGTEADMLNEAGVTTLVNRDGFRFWGSRTCDNAVYIFESYTRAAQVVADTIGEGTFAYADKPMHGSLVRDLIESINREGSKQVSAGYLLGFKCWYDPTTNDASSIKAGTFNLSYNFTPPPPLECLGLQQTFTDQYIADLTASINATTSA